VRLPPSRCRLEHLYGNGGDDLICAARGHNTWRGAGRDTFVFRFSGSVSSDVEPVLGRTDNAIHSFLSGLDKK
jgi:Ca2+-binding RTX toxin-like protein